MTYPPNEFFARYLHRTIKFPFACATTFDHSIYSIESGSLRFSSRYLLTCITDPSQPEFLTRSTGSAYFFFSTTGSADSGGATCRTEAAAVLLSKWLLFGISIAPMQQDTNIAPIESMKVLNRLKSLQKTSLGLTRPINAADIKIRVNIPKNFSNLPFISCLHPPPEPASQADSLQY